MKPTRVGRAVLKHLRSCTPVKIGNVQVGFNMGTVLDEISFDQTKHECGSVGCLAGWSLLLSGKYKTYREYYARFGETTIGRLDPAYEEAAALLGLPYNKAYELFQSSPSGSMTPTEAANRLQAVYDAL